MCIFYCENSHPERNPPNPNNPFINLKYEFMQLSQQPDPNSTHLDPPSWELFFGQ